MLTGKQRAALRKQAAGLNPVFQIGKGGVDTALIDAVKTCIAARELIKLRALETSPQTAREAADLLCEAVGCEPVQVIGRVLVLFKKKNKESQFDWVAK